MSVGYRFNYRYLFPLESPVAITVRAGTMAAIDWLVKLHGNVWCFRCAGSFLGLLVFWPTSKTWWTFDRSFISEKLIFWFLLWRKRNLWCIVRILNECYLAKGIWRDLWWCWFYREYFNIPKIRSNIGFS